MSFLFLASFKPPTLRVGPLLEALSEVRSSQSCAGISREWRSRGPVAGEEEAAPDGKPSADATGAKQGPIDGRGEGGGGLRGGGSGLTAARQEISGPLDGRRTTSQLLKLASSAISELPHYQCESPRHQYESPRRTGWRLECEWQRVHCFASAEAVYKATAVRLIFGSSQDTAR